MSALFHAYWFWLVAVSLLFVGLERIAPRDPAQKLARPGLVTDLVYIVMNGHVWGMVIAMLATPIADALDRLCASLGFDLAQDWASSLPWGVQLAAAFVCTDFLQWCIHNLLHRVPWLWRFHRVHHSIRVMDFWGNFRFHVVESVVYKSLQYIPLALLGFDWSVLFVLAVISTVMGHFNHANLRVRMGPLRYVFNGPEMHIWHHVHASHGPTNVNFAIGLSLWDWLFRTAYLPDQAPQALGFPGVETYPTDVVRQTLAPLTRGWR